MTGPDCRRGLQGTQIWACTGCKQRCRGVAGVDARICTDTVGQSLAQEPHSSSCSDLDLA